LGDWERLRRDWKYSDAMNAVLTFIVLLATGRAIMGTIALSIRRNSPCRLCRPKLVDPELSRLLGRGCNRLF
jgi:hypothetical protein